MCACARLGGSWRWYSRLIISHISRWESSEAGAMNPPPGIGKFCWPRLSFASESPASGSNVTRESYMDEIRTFGEEVSMSRESKKSVSWTIVLVLLGVLALYGGLPVGIPLALTILASAGPSLRTGRD